MYHRTFYKYIDIFGNNENSCSNSKHQTKKKTNKVRVKQTHREPFFLNLFFFLIHFI